MLFYVDVNDSNSLFSPFSSFLRFQINLILCFQMKTMFPSFMAWVFLAQGIHNTFSGELVKVI